MGIFPTRILVAVDGSEEAGLAVEAAAELSRATGSEVHIVHVLPTEERLLGYHFYSEEMRETIIERAEKEARSFLEEQAQRISSEGGKVAETHLRVGHPDKEIAMNTNSYLTAAVTSQVIDARVREAKAYRLASEARRTSSARQPRLFRSPTRPSWFPRTATA